MRTLRVGARDGHTRKTVIFEESQLFTRQQQIMTKISWLKKTLTTPFGIWICQGRDLKLIDLKIPPHIFL